MRVTAANPLDVDRCYRHQETLQELFDEAAGFRTDFAMEALVSAPLGI
jgi:hypothetical protein